MNRPGDERGAAVGARAGYRDTSDEELLSAFVAGDESAFEELTDRHAARVYAICYRYFRNVQDAEDAAQDAFLTLYRRAETFSATSAFSTWMYRVTMNTCNDLARKRARRPRTVPIVDERRNGPDRSEVLASADPGTEDLLASAELAEELRDALAALDPDQREAVILHDVYGYPYVDIATRTGVAVGTVKSRVHRGHARLTDLLRHLRDPSEPSLPSSPPSG